MRLSVVIATYNRADVLCETLRRLNRQTLPSDQYEVIVVDDGSPDNTTQLVEALAPELNYEFRYLRHDNHGPGYTENVGIKAAQYDLLLLMADDIWAEPQLLARHLAGHEQHPAPHMGVLGRVAQSAELPATVLHQHWDPFQYDRFTPGVELDGLYFLACNVSVKRQFLLDNGLFLERRGAAHEDIELGYRLSQKGLRLIYDAAAGAFHQHEETLDGICRRAFERGRNFDLLLDSLPPELALPLYKISAPAAGLAARLRMLPRELIRTAVFNRLTVPAFWRPVLGAAENFAPAQLFASSFAYRGVAGYYLRQGFASMMAESGPQPA